MTTQTDTRAKLPPMPHASSTGHHPDFVAKFLQNVRGTMPLTIEQIDMMLRLIAAARGDQISTFLDLGCGNGVLSAAILDEHPNARGILVDFSAAVLDAAHRQLEPHARRIEFLEADFQKNLWVRRVAPHAPLDVVVSGFAIHHLPDTRKRQIYAEIFELLGPEGIFINIEHVSSATRWTESLSDDYMIDLIFGEQIKSSPRKTRATVAREYYARAAEEGGVLAPLEVQCDWLREAGFENVECYLKVLELAVFGGQKPAE
jgi:ubiquinone/menaquinone biosynthesis C-methylase UbiE